MACRTLLAAFVGIVVVSAPNTRTDTQPDVTDAIQSDVPPLPLGESMSSLQSAAYEQPMTDRL